MALSRIAREFAAEIAAHDWSDAPWRVDRAGHRRERDTPHRLTEEALDTKGTNNVRANVMMVAAQVLGHMDPSLDLLEFAQACGVYDHTEAALRAGTRRDGDGNYLPPGQLR
ncbi:hypothetical protein [Microbispora rosea]|uniref:hypothetical protein n=1 Tax=Microbispora rosea TaxID=58117 RepID=UPI0037B129E8